MKNKQGMVLPLVMVMMVLSHLMYVSLLAYNQIQTQTYHELLDFYEAKVELNLVESERDDYSVKPLIEWKVKELIDFQSIFLLRGYTFEKSLVDEAQKQILQAVRNDHRYLLVLSHRLYLNKEKEKWGEYIENYQVEGIVHEAKLPQKMGDLPIEKWRDEIETQLVQEGFEIEHTMSWTGQKTFELPLEIESNRYFISGDRFVLGRRGNKHDLQIRDSTGNLKTRRTLEPERIHFYVESHLEIFREAENE